MPLFVYGLLKVPGRANDACTAGDLRVRQGSDAAAIFGPTAASTSLRDGGVGLVWGQLLTEEEQKLINTDSLERPDYMRVAVRMMNSSGGPVNEGGQLAWAYEYVGGEPFFKMPVCPHGEFPVT